MDVSGSEGRNPVEDFKIINKELKKYSEKLSTRKQIIVANKIDIIPEEEKENNENIKAVEKLAKDNNMELFKISAATNDGLSELMNHVAEVLKKLPKEEITTSEERKVYTLKDDKDEVIVRKNNEDFIVEGKAIERLISKVNLDDNESTYFFHKGLERLGVNARLKNLGIKEGDTVIFNGWEFEWYE